VAGVAGYNHDRFKRFHLRRGRKLENGAGTLIFNPFKYLMTCSLVIKFR
jgi:hypothetical protein